MKKLVFITNQFKTGGVESVFINIADYIAPLQVYLLPLHSCFDKELLNSLPKNVNVIQSKKTIKRNIFGIIQILLYSKELKENSIFGDAVIINFSDTLSTLLLSYFLAGTKTISWIHCNPKELLKSKTHKFYIYLLSKCQNLVFICKSQMEYFYSLSAYKKNSKDKAIVVTNFINIERITNFFKYTNINIESKYFLMVARLDERSKDFFTVLKAYSLLDTKIKEQYKLVFAGDGPERNKVEKYIEEFELKKYVVLLGNVINPYKYMKNCSIYIHSSKSEGFSLVLLEALSCYCNIVASDCFVGPKEILDNGKYGKLFIPQDYSDLNNQIKLAMSNPIDSTMCIERVNYINALGKAQLENFIKGVL